MKKWISCLQFCLLLALSALNADITNYILPEDHFLQKALATVFCDPQIVASRQSLQMAGFDLFEHDHRGIAIARHPELPGHLVKVFINDVPHELQVQNYIARIEGSRALQEFIDEQGLEHIVTPKKWLYPLKENDLGIMCVLLVQELDICTTSETRRLYSTIDQDVLHELCMVVQEFRGLDSVTKNMPFTKDGKIAFVDTEKWKSQRSTFLGHVKPLLDEEGLAIVDSYDTRWLVEDWLLPKYHPLQDKLRELFTDKKMFASPQTLSNHGFDVNKRVHKRLMVFTHPDVPEYIFKKFQNGGDSALKLDKYLIRLEGAAKVREAISKHGLENIVVPNKWLYRMPYSHNDYMVIAERFDLCPGDDRKDGENVRRYRTMSKKTLEELCTIMVELGGCDAWPRNQPFTKQGKIAFIDTEHVGHKEAHFERHIMPLLDEQMRLYAQKRLAAA